MKRIFCSIALSLALFGSFSTAVLATEGSVTSNINRLYYHESHAGLLVTVNGMSDLGGCGNAAWYILPDIQTHYKEVVALLMSAQAQNKQVILTIGDCFQGYGRIKHAMLVN